MFNISDKVVFVDDSYQGKKGWDYKDWTIKINNIYVVAGIWLDAENEYVISLVGHPNICTTGYVNSKPFPIGFEAGYRAFRFRKLEDIKQENALKNKKIAPIFQHE